MLLEQYRASGTGWWNYSYCGHVPNSLGITAFVRTESNTSVALFTSERQLTTVVIQLYRIHKTVYIEGLCPTENIIKRFNLFYAAHILLFDL
jgi:hypothetical protein